MTPAQQLAAVRERTQPLVASLYNVTMQELLPALQTHGVRVVSWQEVDPARQAALGVFFRDAILPVLTPLAIDISRPFPLLSSLSLNLALLLDAAPRGAERRLAIVQVPSRLTRLVRVAGRGGCHARAPRRHHPRPSLAALSRTEHSRSDAHPAVTGRRNRAGRRGGTHSSGARRAGSPEAATQRRRSGSRSKRRPPANCSTCCAGRSTSRLTTCTRCQVRWTCASLWVWWSCTGLEDLRDPPAQAVDVLAGEQADLFAVLDERDVLLHHPYESFDPVVALIAQRRRRSRRAGDQADALPHERRLADRRRPAARGGEQQAGHGARRADGAIRRGAEHPAGRARSKKPAPT